MHHFSQQLQRTNALQAKKRAEKLNSPQNALAAVNKANYTIIDESLSVDDLTAQVKRYQSVWFPYIFASLQSYIDDILHQSDSVMADVHSFGPVITSTDRNAAINRKLLHTATFGNVVNFLTRIVCAVEDISIRSDDAGNKYFQKPIFTRDMAHILKQTRVFFDFPLPGDAVLNRNDPYHPNNPNRGALYNHLMPNLLKTGEGGESGGDNVPNFETFGVFDAEFDHLFSELEQNVVADMNKKRLAQLFKFNAPQSPLRYDNSSITSPSPPTLQQLLAR